MSLVLRTDQKRYLKLEPLQKVYEALEREIQPLGVRLVPTQRALDCFCASRYSAMWHVPRFDVSAMDGYALRYGDLAGSKVLRVRGEVFPSTRKPPKLGEAEAYYVATGSPLPIGADTVVRVEQTRRLDGERIEIGGTISKGKNVSFKAEDFKKAQTIVGEGERINPAALSLLVYFGIRRVKVYRRPLVGVLSIGDELCDFKLKLQVGRVYNNYSYLVCSYLERLGYQATNFGVCKDDKHEVSKAVEQALRRVDVLFTIGGTSVGLKDNTPDALTLLPARLLFHGVRAVPIKPAGAAKVDKKVVVLLPAHPVSLVLSLHVIGLPVLSLLSGGTLDSLKSALFATLGKTVRNERNIDALYLVRLKRDGELVALPLEWGSNLMSSVLTSQGFITLKAREELKRGAKVRVELLGAQELMGV